nr:MAG TPA: hypothetical protein [Caudoviricetes sp.]
MFPINGYRRSCLLLGVGARFLLRVPGLCSFASCCVSSGFLGRWW